jgi:hypothetical protein
MIYLLNHASSPLNSFYLPSTCSSSSLGMCYLLMVSYWSCIFSSFFLTFLFFFLSEYDISRLVFKLQFSFFHFL